MPAPRRRAWSQVNRMPVRHTWGEVRIAGGLAAAGVGLAMLLVLAGFPVETPHGAGPDARGQPDHAVPAHTAHRFWL